MRRHDEQVFYRGEDKDSIRWHALPGRNYRALSSGRGITEHLLPLAKDTSGKGERRANFPKERKAYQRSQAWEKFESGDGSLLPAVSQESLPGAGYSQVNLPAMEDSISEEGA